MFKNIQSFQLYFTFLLLFSTTCLIYFQIHLHSDILFLDDLVRDILLNNGQWQDWKLTPAPAYLPDMALYFIGSFIFPFAEQRIMFVVLLQSGLLLFSLLWLGKILHHSLTLNAKTIITLMLVFVTLVAAKSNMWLYFNTANNHFSTYNEPLKSNQ